MLQPSDRHHLFESLRPPESYQLDSALGTTFTLDLLALLTAPLAFTTFDWADEKGHLTHSPQALLATMQQYADRITIFCQTGKIAIPKAASLLYSYLENSVIEVNAPRIGGLFHPKIWVLRFVAPGQPVLYRFLCLSRNLTFDRSWDTLLSLDGVLNLDGGAIATNRPLSDFVAALPTFAYRTPISTAAQARVEQMQTELQYVQFELPPGFEALRFHPLGMTSESSRSLLDGGDRLLVMAPFVSEQRLRYLSQQGKRNVLISRPEEMEKIPLPTLKAFTELYQISPNANPEDSDDADASYVPLVGLHAKLYIAERGSHAHIWTGSANATDAAFDRNVEFLMELVGRKQQVGIDSLLGFAENDLTLRNLLEPFTPPTEPAASDESLRQMLYATEHSLLKLNPSAHASPLDGTEQYCLTLKFDGGQSLDYPPELLVRCYPMTRKDLAIALSSQAVAPLEFQPISGEAITSFFAFEVLNREDNSRLASFILNVPLEGAPTNRRQLILKRLLKDKHQVLKLLLFLLADNRADARSLLEMINPPTATKSTGEKGAAAVPIFPLFEALVQALHSNPARLDQIASIIDDLQQLPSDEQRLPDNFDEIWQPIYTARQRLNP